MPVFNDVRTSFDRISNAGYDQYIISNGTLDLLSAIASNADIEGLVNGIISADEIKEYKPSVRFYEHVCDKIGNSPENIVHAATLWYDIYGAMNHGMKTVWVNRDRNPWERFDGEADLTVDSLLEVAEVV